jgi:hypothetical protein
LGSRLNGITLLLNNKLSVQKLAQLAETMTAFEFTHFEPFDNWVHESGKVVLVGEAAHPIVVSTISDGFSVLSSNTCD